MIIKTYVAKKGSHLTNADALRIGTYMEENQQRAGDDGFFDAEEMVKLARPKRSPIHNDFEWDDTVAGREYRLEQARRITRSIDVIFTNGGGEIRTRAFHHVIVESNGEKKSAYAPAQIVWERPDLAAQVVERARRELASWAVRYREYESLSDAHGLVERALELFDLLEEDDEDDV